MEFQDHLSEVIESYDRGAMDETRLLLASLRGNVCTFGITVGVGGQADQHYFPVQIEADGRAIAKFEAARGVAGKPQGFALLPAHLDQQLAHLPVDQSLVVGIAVR